MEACRGADLVTTDVWTSMGYEAENETRRQAFADWRVDAEVIDGPQSVVWDEAENRMHAQKALMEYLLLGKLTT